MKENIFFEQDRFSDILSAALKENNTSQAELLNDLAVTGQNIRHNSLSEYVRGVHVPTFERARAILDLLNYQMSDDELSECLRYSRSFNYEQIDPLLAEVKYFKRYVTISYNRLNPNETPETVEELLSSRINEVAGTTKQFNWYVTQLIKMDLEHPERLEEMIENERIKKH